jgi:nitroreductase
MEFFDVLRTRRSIRAYQATPVPADAVEKIKEAIRLAPTGCNFQPFRFIFITNEEVRKAVAACYPGAWLAEVPMIVAAVGNADAAWHRRDGGESIVDIDVAIAMEHLQLAATDCGLASCWLGAFDRQGVNKVLNIQSPWGVVALAPLGYPAQDAAPRSNKSDEELFTMID